MWELRKDKQAMKLLERLYPHYTNECLACRFHTKKRVMDKFGERYYKTEEHKEEESHRSQLIRELIRQKKPIPPRKCPFSKIIGCEYTFSPQEYCYFAPSFRPKRDK